MPTYVYKCTECGLVEARQRLGSKPLRRCPECKQSGVRRVPQAVGISFKGVGFYSTDTRKDKVSNAE
jgi:putative FmdB family regulatory protein